MSVLIKGFKMPISCEFCHLCRWCWDTYAKGLWLEGGIKGRRSWCPLVEVPTPHGDLIDREEAMKGLHTICVSEIGYSHRCIHPEYVEFAPTVIEGEA